MNKYPKVNYIGNKEKLVDWIIQCLPLSKGTVLDLFSGGCSVSYALKKAGYRVITNDVLYSNYCISKAIIENSSVTLEFNPDEKFLERHYSSCIFNKISWMVNKLYYEEEVKELSSLIKYSFTLEGYKKFIFLALLRRAMIRKIPYSRMNVKWSEIIKLRDEDYSYKKYKRRRAYHNQSFIFHIKDNLKDYNASIFDNGFNNKSFQMDAFNMLESLKNRVDIIYIDPPYPSTMNNYREFYGSFDEMLDKNIEYSDFTNKFNFINNILNIIKVSKDKTKYLALSLNNKSNPSYGAIVEAVEDYVKSIHVFKRDHTYKVTGKENKNDNYEILMILEV